MPNSKKRISTKPKPAAKTLSGKPPKASGPKTKPVVKSTPEKLPVVKKKPLKSTPAKPTTKGKNRFISTKTNLTVLINGETRVISSTHFNYKKVLALVKRGRWKDAQKYLSVERITKAVTQTPDAKKVLKKLTGSIAMTAIREKLIREVRAGRDTEQFGPFFERCAANPYPGSVEQLFGFLQTIRAPFTKEGKFLGFKAVKSNFTDCHTGQVDNTPGKTIPRMAWDRVDKGTPHSACGRGYHVGSLGYASDFHQGHLLLVEVDPADVCSVPSHDSKLRCTFYRVVREISYPEAKELQTV